MGSVNSQLKVTVKPVKGADHGNVMRRRGDFVDHGIIRKCGVARQSDVKDIRIYDRLSRLSLLAICLTGGI
jgi:hypothetical protein